MYIIKKKLEFDEFRRCNNVVTSKFFVVKYYPNSLDYNQFGIIISKKVSKLAVDRNLIRRRIKAIIHKIEKFIVDKNLNYLLIVKNRIIDASYAEIEQELIKTFGIKHVE